MNISEDIPPERIYWNPYLSNNIIIIQYNLYSDIIYYYYTLPNSYICYKQKIRQYKRYDKRSI